MGPPTLIEHNGLALEVSHLSLNLSYLNVSNVRKKVLFSETQPYGLDFQRSIIVVQGIM